MLLLAEELREVRREAVSIAVSSVPVGSPRTAAMYWSKLVKPRCRSRLASRAFTSSFLPP